MQRGGYPAILLLCCSVFVCVLSATNAVAKESYTDASSNVPLFDQVISQPFMVSVVSGKYGVFNATLNLRGSLNFPERIHGELIPIGEQRTEGKGQIALEHFDTPRELSGEISPLGASDAHPSLLSIEIQLEFSGSTAGTLAAWTLPANTRLFEKRLSEIEEGDAVPTAKTSFSFVSESTSMSPSTLSDVTAVARTATGVVALEEGLKGTFTLVFLSEHEFSLNLVLHDKESVADYVWLHGYAMPNEALLSRTGKKTQPWWHTWALVALGVLLFVIQILTAYLDSTRENKLEAAKLAAKPETEKKKLK